MKTHEMTTKENRYPLPLYSPTYLIKACITAVFIASILLILVILPSEYNIDPTGIGKSLGLTDIAQASNPSTSTSLSTTNLTTSTNNTVETLNTILQARHTSSVRSDTVDIIIPAKKGLEYKLLMDKFTHLEYEWRTDGSPLYFDFHGEPKGDKTGYFESFSITTSSQMKGSLTTPFTGSHGWYWKNKTNKPITVTLSTKGDYSIKG